MRRFILCLAATTSLAAADPVPAMFIPARSELAVQLPDLARSRERWALTPYSRLLQTGWGRMLVGEWEHRLERAAPGAGGLLAGLQAGAFAMQSDPAAATRLTVAATGGTQLAALPALFAMLKLPGRLASAGTVVAWTNGDGAPQAGVAPPVPAAVADAGFVLRAERWLPGLEGGLRVDLQLDAAGVRETGEISPTAASRLAAAAPRTWAAAQELRRLPATTLWAATWQGGADLAAALPGPEEASIATIETWLAGLGLPGWRETIAASNGPATLWLAEGAPFPTLTAALSVQEAVAKRWIVAATQQLNLAVTPEGASGYVGLLPFSIGRTADGRLVITSDPNGITAWSAAKPGFAEHRGVTEVLAKAPPRTLLLGAGRGGPSWAALAQLSVPLFTAMGAPQAVSLPVDLRTATDRGWLYLRLLEDGTVRSEAGGLFGGPCTTAIAAGIAVPATMWLQGQLRRENKVPAVEPETPAPPPVF